MAKKAVVKKNRSKIGQEFYISDDGYGCYNKANIKDVYAGDKILKVKVVAEYKAVIDLKEVK